MSELCETAHEHTREYKYHFVGPVEVTLSADPHARIGDLEIDAAIVAGPGGAGSLVLADGRRIQLGDEPARIGRLPDCTIPLSDSRPRATTPRSAEPITASSSSTSTPSTARR